MNKLFQHRPKKLGVELALGLAMLLLFVNSCRKDSGSNAPTAPELIVQARSYFESEIAELPRQNDNNLRHSLNKTPLWDKASIKKTAVGDAVIVPIRYEHKIMFDYDQGQSYKALDQGSYLMIYTNKQQKMQAEWVTLLPVAASNEQQFMGSIIVEQWDGKFKKGYLFGEDGKSLDIEPVGTQIFRKISYNRSEYCFTINHYGYISVGGYDGPMQLVGSETYCVGSSNNGETTKNYQNNDGGGGPAPTDYLPDCTGLVGGIATWSNECNTCIGGTTGLTACPVDTAMNSKFVQNQKAMCALNKLMKDGFFKNILNNFIGTNKPIDLTFKLDSIPQTPGFQTDANTIPNPATWNSNNIDITLAENVINNLTSLEVGLALLHEGVHAEIFRKLISIQGLSNLSTNNFPTLFNLYTQYKVNQGYTHEYMANHYVDLMASALGKFDNNKFTIDYYKAIAWSGLKGTTAYNNLSAAKKSEITTKETALLLNRSKTNCDDSL